MAPVGNQTRATLEEGERSHRYAIPASLRLIPASPLMDIRGNMDDYKLLV